MMPGELNLPVRTLADIAPLAPELVVVIGAFALLMLDLFMGERRRVVTHGMAVAVLTTAVAFAWRVRRV